MCARPTQLTLCSTYEAIQLEVKQCHYLRTHSNAVIHVHKDFLVISDCHTYQQGNRYNCHVLNALLSKC